jgi:hypothetical protein
MLGLVARVGAHRQDAHTHMLWVTVTEKNETDGDPFHQLLSVCHYAAMATKQDDIQQQPTRAVPEANELNDDVVMRPEAPVQGDAAKPDAGTMPGVPEAGWVRAMGRCVHCNCAEPGQASLQTVLHAIFDEHIDLDTDPAAALKDCIQLLWEGYRKLHLACQKELDQLKQTCEDQETQNHQLFLEQGIHLEQIKTHQQEAQDMANVMAQMYQNQQEYT